MGNRFSLQSPQKKPAESTDGPVEKNKKASEDSRARPRSYAKFTGATNPFIIFFLRLRSKKLHVPVTTIARIAGKKWSQMNDRQRKKYIDLANAERRRRQKLQKKRLNQAEVRSAKNLRSKRRVVCRRK